MDTTSTRGDSHISPAQSCAPACAAYWAERRTAGKDSRSLTLFVPRSIFGQALDDGLIVRNPAAKGAGERHRAEATSGFSAGDRATLRAHVVERSARRGVVG
jgi:hypothetical protein